MKNIYKKYGIKFKDEKLISTALTHSSYSNEHGGECYERLEYLGDAVLEIVCSDYLYNNTSYPEGEIENGLNAVKRVFHELIVPYIDRQEDFLMDYKSLLQESVQTVKKSVEYKLIDESGPAHNKTFKVEVIIDGLIYGVGSGSSKKEAEQNAAKEAYNKRA